MFLVFHIVEIKKGQFPVARGQPVTRIFVLDPAKESCVVPL